MGGVDSDHGGGDTYLEDRDGGWSVGINEGRMEEGREEEGGRREGREEGGGKGGRREERREGGGKEGRRCERCTRTMFTPVGRH